MHVEDARHRRDGGGAVGVHDRCPGGLMLCGRWVIDGGCEALMGVDGALQASWGMGR